MGMPATVEVINGSPEIFEKAFLHFKEIDERFSTYKSSSEISKINRGEIRPENYSAPMQEIFALAEKTKHETNGFFDIRTPQGSIDPSGLVKGWAIFKAAEMIRDAGYQNFWVEIAGDIQVSGTNAEGKAWRVGVRNPFKREEIVKIVELRGEGMATSGDYIRGGHIYEPHTGKTATSNIVSLTVIGPDVYEADRFATAAFAMGEAGLNFIEGMPGFEGYAVTRDNRAILTSGFPTYADAQQKSPA